MSFFPFHQQFQINDPHTSVKALRDTLLELMIIMSCAKSSNPFWKKYRTLKNCLLLTRVKIEFVNIPQLLCDRTRMLVQTRCWITRQWPASKRSGPSYLLIAPTFKQDIDTLYYFSTDAINVLCTCYLSNPKWFALTKTSLKLTAVIITHIFITISHAFTSLEMFFANQPDNPNVVIGSSFT